MEYKFVEKPENKRGHNWYGHHVSFFLNHSRDLELFEYLEESFGSRGKRYRYNMRNRFDLYFAQRQTVRFKEKSDALRFKLAWIEDEDPMSGWYESMRQLSKVYMNSSFGSLAKISPVLPTSSGILPHIQQKPRGNNLPKDDIVILDYESGFDRNWYSEYVVKMPCNDWMDYQAILNSEVILEEQSDKTEVDQTSKSSTF